MIDLDACVEFLQHLIRTRSMPGEEGELARLVEKEMEDLGYDDVSIDEAGNVIGLVRGADGAPSVMFNTHLDHVDAGDPEGWSHHPFRGDLVSGEVWGRGAVDIKGPLAAQVHGVGALARHGERPPGDVYVTATVQEEVGGLGARYLAPRVSPDLVLVGEPSRNEIRRGHRGRVELRLRVRGRMSHASMPELGANPLPTVGAFLASLPELGLPDDATLGRATVSPTLIRTDQTSPNVIPGEACLRLDCRTVPGQDAESLCDLLLPLLRRAERPGTAGEFEVPVTGRRSWTGHEMTYPADNPPYAIAPDHPAVRSAARVLADALGAEPALGVWRFATDGGHFAEAGMTVVGFGPGDDELAHTVEERIAVDELARGARGNLALARSWAAAYASEA